MKRWGGDTASPGFFHSLPPNDPGDEDISLLVGHKMIYMQHGMGLVHEAQPPKAQRLKGILGIRSRYVLIFNIAVTTRPLPHAAIIPVENDVRKSSTHVFLNEDLFIMSKGSL